MREFFGKYRGKVTGNVDPRNLGRIQVEVPGALSDGMASWAMPAVPYAGKGVGFLAIPPIGANVWVEFEQGNLDYPIWSGCYWGEGEQPATPLIPDVAIFKTGAITLKLAEGGDKPGLSIEVGPPLASPPLTLTMESQTITLGNGSDVSVTIALDSVAVKVGKQCSLTISMTDVTLANGSASAALGQRELALGHSGTSVKLDGQGAAVGAGAASLKVESSRVEAACATAKIAVTPAQVELSNSAASIKLSPLSVNMNNGALEVI